MVVRVEGMKNWEKATNCCEADFVHPQYLLYFVHIWGTQNDVQNMFHIGLLQIVAV